MSIGMIRLEFDGFVQAYLHLVPDPLRERLAHRNLLRIAPERLGVKIEGVDEIRRRFCSASARAADFGKISRFRSLSVSS
jgi:hypothetical protein